ncbi:nucleoside-triphosphatase [Azonexus hydrophilus]|uniref:nucleoside-triphosphatase n=1 Tax=Azonexus hydrophilus TaxID=418702 RepID=UPI001962B46F|nr:nucleoside-triphosphatase [Azonexus hydrophilus]
MLTPHAALDRCREGGTRQLVLLSGERGAGKTTWCRSLADLAQEQGLIVAGLASPAVFCDGRKTAIDLLDLSCGETRRLAERAGFGTLETAGLGWRFDPATLAWGNALIKSAGACDLLMIDEMGPLEFSGRDGFTAGFAVIDACRYRLAVIVVRPKLMPIALQNWPQAQIVEPTDTV